MDDNTAGVILVAMMLLTILALVGTAAWWSR